VINSNNLQSDDVLKRMNLTREMQALSYYQIKNGFKSLD